MYTSTFVLQFSGIRIKISSVHHIWDCQSLTNKIIHLCCSHIHGSLLLRKTENVSGEELMV